MKKKKKKREAFSHEEVDLKIQTLTYKPGCYIETSKKYYILKYRIHSIKCLYS